MNKILLVGLGSLGVRYAEGISKLKNKFSLDILELDFKKFQTLIEAQILDQSVVSAVSLNSLSSHYDLCIVATPSLQRATVVQSILQRSSIDAWILEKILAPSIEDLEIIKTEIGPAPAWVNTTRRLTVLYQTINEKLLDNRLSINVVLKDFSLGCNGIHFIDTLLWLSGDNLDSISVISDGGWFKAKRKGYKEFNGKIKALTKLGSSLTIDNTKPISANQIRVEQNHDTILIDEEKGFSFNGVWYETGRLEYQSELTAPMIESIFVSGNCNLPTLSESSQQHRFLLEAFANNKFLFPNGGRVVPIT